MTKLKNITRRLFMLCLLAGISLAAQAQPARSRVTKTPTTATKTAAKTATPPAADRAALMFPTSAEMPEDVVWRRDIYRTLDLTKDANAPLYYPVQPSGKNQNLFTYIFRLWLSDRLPVYEYKLDGNESFEKKDCLKGDSAKEAFLTRYKISYEGQGKKIVVPESDIPSAQVKRYFIKESSYFDQQSATYKTRVTALCPVMIEGDDFMLEEDMSNGMGGTPKPLFWVNYDDLAPYLSRMPLMASNLNNVTNMTVADYFTLNKYEGKIYKTNNMLGKTLAQVAGNDSTKLSAEQKRIEKELETFRNNIFGDKQKRDSLDSIANLDPKVVKKMKRTTSASSDTKAEKATKTKTRRAKSSGSSGGTVSVRRQRH